MVHKDKVRMVFEFEEVGLSMVETPSARHHLNSTLTEIVRLKWQQKLSESLFDRALTDYWH